MVAATIHNNFRTQVEEMGHYLDFLGGSDGEASAYHAGDRGLIPGSGGSPGEGNGDPL